MLTMYEILKTINQIVTDSKDLPPPYNKKIGMKREEVGERIQSRRIIDGFSAKFAGDVMRICYSSSMKVSEIDEDFKEEIRMMIEKIVSFIKEEFKDKKGSSLKLKNVSNDEPFIFIGVQGITQDDCKYSGYMDYKILNSRSDEPSNFDELSYEAKMKNNKKNFKKLEKMFEIKYK